MVDPFAIAIDIANRIWWIRCFDRS